MHQSIPPAPSPLSSPRATAGHLPVLSVPGVEHLQILHCPGAGHLLTLSSIVIEGKKLAKLNKMNWTAVAQPL